MTQCQQHAAQQEREIGQHTPEPWEVIGDNVFTPVGAARGDGIAASPHDGWHIAECGNPRFTMVGSGEEFSIPLNERAANARRIVACVNACAGIDPVVLASWSLQGLKIKPMLDEAQQAVIEAHEQRDELTKQRDELLAGRKWPVMGYGNVAIGGGLQPDGSSALLYMDMGETRPIDADTTDLFPVGSYADPKKLIACIRFKDSAAIQQTIDVLREMQEEIASVKGGCAQHSAESETQAGSASTDETQGCAKGGAE